MNEEEKKYPQLGVRIDNELLCQLQEQAKKEERSMSQVMRIALKQYLAEQRESL